jgi:hypothetical protein
MRGCSGKIHLTSVLVALGVAAASASLSREQAGQTPPQAFPAENAARRRVEPRRALAEEARESGTCRSSDPEHLCLAVKWVAFKDPATGAPIMTEAEARETIDGVNRLWAQCKLGFSLERFQPVSSLEQGIRFRIRNYSDLTEIRENYQDPERLLVAFTGPWDRKGSLGDSGANAWTSMPGSGPYGAVLEGTVARNANLVAHELGHYLNLGHSTNELNLMNAVIYRRSIQLDPDLCSAARATAREHWVAMER